MAEEVRNNEEAGLKSQMAKYARWIFLGAIGFLLILTVVMAVVRRFSEG
jgi:hypothetical protein